MLCVAEFCSAVEELLVARYVYCCVGCVIVYVVVIYVVVVVYVVNVNVIVIVIVIDVTVDTKRQRSRKRMQRSCRYRTYTMPMHIFKLLYCKLLCLFITISRFEILLPI